MKKTLLTLILALSLLLSGCSLVVKDPVVDAAQVILEINGQAVDKQTFLNSYNAMLNAYYQMQAYGLQMGEVSPEQLIKETKDLLVRQTLISQQAEAQKVDELTEDEQKDLDAQVETAWQGLRDQVKGQDFADTTLTGDELNAALDAQLEEHYGRTRAMTEQQIKEQFLSNKLEKVITQDVVVEDEAVKADFDAKVEAAKASYETDANTYGTEVNSGRTVYYAPAGYRFIKQILVKFTEEDQKKIDELTQQQSAAQTELDNALAEKTANDNALNAESLTEEDQQSLEALGKDLQAKVDEAQAKVNSLAGDVQQARETGYAAIQQKAQDLYERAKTEEFDVLVKEANQDTGMPERGYAVREGFSSFDEAFMKPAMALKNVGDVAEPSPGIYGYYIVQYAADIPEGPVDYESVRQGLHDTLLTAKKNETWEAAITKWTEEADIKEHLDRLEN
jgi:hypothetical protein